MICARVDGAPEDGAAPRSLPRRTRLLEALRQRLALDVLQRHIGPPVVLTRLVEPADVRMIEPSDRQRLAVEALLGVLRPQRLGPDQLERDLAPELLVEREVHVAHAAPAERCENPEMGEATDVWRRTRFGEPVDRARAGEWRPIASSTIGSSSSRRSS